MAVNVIVFLGDRDEITYKLLWYDYIGSVEIKNYYVERINDQERSGMCGFVYDLGETDMGTGNHIHVQIDKRILQSLEYVMFRWIQQLIPCNKDTFYNQK